MRAGGINWLSVVVAAVAFYAIGFIIYGLLIPAEMEATAESRMMFGVVMPLMTAIFMALLFKWGSVKGAVTGAQWGAVIALASAVPAMLYGWVYGVGPIDMTIIDSGHLLLGHVAVGAVLGGWR